jgi:hypothetical protein
MRVTRKKKTLRVSHAGDYWAVATARDLLERLVVGRRLGRALLPECYGPG